MKKYKELKDKDIICKGDSWRRIYSGVWEKVLNREIGMRVFMCDGGGYFKYRRPIKSRVTPKNVRR